MNAARSRRTVAIGLAAALVLAVGAWVAGAQIRSPAQVAAETAAPDPSAITVPVERRTLSSEVIVRGTVRYGSPQPVVLAASDIKQNSGATGADIVTTRPKRGARVGEGSVAMSVSGRPVFVLRGAQPSHRDMRPGSRGPDIRQLEAALRRLGFFPGPVDGRYDGETAAAVADWYQSEGWEPFSSTDTQLDALRTARANAAQARDAYLQARVTIETARGSVPPGDIAQARIDLETARDNVDTAQHTLATQGRGVALALANERRDNAVAAADTATKRAALNRARDTQLDAQRTLVEAAPATPPAELAALQAAVRQAGDDVVVAQEELNASVASADATREAGRNAVAVAKADRARALKALPRARRQVVLAERRLRLLTTPGDTSLQKLVADAAKKEADSTAREVSRLATKMGIQVPADEVLFFSTLPLRVDSVRVRRGDTVSGRVMTVSNSRLAIDSSLSPNDAKLVRPGATVKIEEPDLGVRATGVVTQVADRPGTHKVDPGRVYVSITPRTAPAQLVGASVKLTIAVKSTEEAVLTVPVTALSVGADGNARVQLQRDGRAQYVQVTPGLAAQGLVEIRPAGGQLAAGDLVVTGTKDGSTQAGGSTAQGGSSGASGSPGASGSSGASGTSGTSGSSGSSGSSGASGSSGSSGAPGTSSGRATP
jgi:peptidoglycan hydrolase-like protein with peptidoglycan-binding domain